MNECGDDARDLGGGAALDGLVVRSEQNPSGGCVDEIFGMRKSEFYPGNSCTATCTATASASASGKRPMGGKGK